jgi:dipeptidyl aminopeptidase/acylaminoacyl peptidase
MLLLVFAACSPRPDAASATAAPESPAPVQTDLPSDRPSTETAPPPLVASLTVRPSATASATATPTATTTPTPPHPLSIDYLRQQTFTGSELIIEETLARGANYDRFIASYESEGLRIRALLTIPGGDPPDGGWPVVIFNHGFIPPDVYRTTERYVAYVDGFATNGFIVFRSDYRGHDQSEGEASGAYGNPDYTIDVLNATAAMKNFEAANPDRIGLWGHSMGGYITLRAMVVDPDIRAGVIWAGVVGSYADLFEYWFRRFESFPTPTGTPGTRGRWRTELLDVYGTPDDNPDFWSMLSANTYLDDISGPVQIHHGTEDADVPLVLSEILAGELRQADKTYEFYIYEGNDHNLAQSFSLAMVRSINFFTEHLAPLNP